MVKNMEKLIQNINGQIGLLRPWTSPADGYKETYVTLLNKNGVYQEYKLKDLNLPFAKNVTGLPIESWTAIDQQVMDYAKDGAEGWNDVVNAGLIHDVSVYSKKFTSQKIGGTEDAVKDMDGVSNRKVDARTFDVDSIPLWVTHKDFEISWRDRGAYGRLPYDGGNLGIEWDSSAMAEGVYRINQLNEYTLFNGYSVPYDGSYVYGYQNFGGRNQCSLTYDWLDSGTDAGEVFDDILSMYEDCVIDNIQPNSRLHFYFHTAVQKLFMDDYNAYRDGTLYERVMKLAGVEKISFTSQLSSYKNAILVRMDPRSVRIVRGTPGIIPVMWYDNAGFMDKLTLLSIQEPQLRQDAEGYTSITHGLKT